MIGIHCMPNQAGSRVWNDAQVEKSGPGTAGAGRFRLLADAALRLGARPVALRLVDAVLRTSGVTALRLADDAVPTAQFLPSIVPPAPALPAGEAARIVQAASALPARPDWHGGFDPGMPALALELHRHGGARPVWEASRLAALPLLAQAARLDPRGGHLARAGTLLALWCVENPPFRGVAWACGQEAALRALHLALALALLDADHAPPPGARALLRLCATRIAATPLYAAAQDNNHPISEAAGAYACALLLGADTRRHAARLSATVARLVEPDGGFAQVSPGYARLALDVLSVVEWLRRRRRAPEFPAPLAMRAAALAAWLHRVTHPATGEAARLGLEDDSAFADLSLVGPRDMRATVERAARLFAGCRADLPKDPGCAWLGLACPDLPLARPPRWRSSGTLGWHTGEAAAVLRTGPLRFRPGQADLLHLSLRDGDGWVIRDGGTGSYDPPAAWWWAALSGAAGHNAPVFDEEEPMPRAGRFLLARWPRTRPVPGGAALRDARGRRVTREVAVSGRDWTVTDRLDGRFRRVAWHWRLRPADWRRTEDGVASSAARIAVLADAPLLLSLESGWESPAYGAVRGATLLRVTAEAPVTRMALRIHLP
jgi:hypothetical protein